MGKRKLKYYHIDKDKDRLTPIYFPKTGPMTFIGGIFWLLVSLFIGLFYLINKVRNNQEDEL